MAQAQGPLGPRPLGPNHSQHQSAKTFQSGPEATKRGAADKTLKSGSEAVNAHRTIVRTSMCRHIKYVFLKILE